MWVQCINGQDFHEMHADLRGSSNFKTLNQWIEPDFHSWAVEITEPRPDMKIKVATFTVPKKSYYIVQ